MGFLGLLQWRQDLGGTETRGGCGVAPGVLGITWTIPEPGWLRGSPGTALLCGTWRRGMPPPTCPGTNLQLGVPPVPGAPSCLPTPAVGRG